MIAGNFGRVLFFYDLPLMGESEQKKIKAMIAIKFCRVLFFYDLPLMGESGQKNLKMLLAISCSRMSEVRPGIGGHLSYISSYFSFLDERKGGKRKSRR